MYLASLLFLCIAPYDQKTNLKQRKATASPRQGRGRRFRWKCLGSFYWLVLHRIGEHKMFHGFNVPRHFYHSKPSKMKPKNWKSFIQIREGSILKFDYPEEGFESPCWTKPPKKKPYTGEVTDHTRKRILTAVDVMLLNTPMRKIYNPVTDKEHDFRVGFATLTVTDDVAPNMKEGNEALGRLLRHFKAPWKRRKMSEPLTRYVWKAELQKRGTLHYHITTNAFIHYIELGRVWNDLQKEYGWLNNYHATHGHWYPNSTDIHAVWQVSNLGGYISKYMGKKAFIDASEMGFPSPIVPLMLGGKIWGCSDDLRGRKRFTAPMDEYTWKHLQASLQYQAITQKDFERCSFYCGAGLRELSISNRTKYQDWMM